MIETYLTDEELERFKSVTDEELNKLLQEVNENFGDKYRIDETFYQYKKYFFSKPVKRVRYTLYAIMSSPSVQCINFASDGKSSINTSVTKSYLMTYFYGLLTSKSVLIRRIELETFLKWFSKENEMDVSKHFVAGWVSDYLEKN